MSSKQSRNSSPTYISRRNETVQLQNLYVSSHWKSMPTSQKYILSVSLFLRQLCYLRQDHFSLGFGSLLTQWKFYNQLPADHFLHWHSHSLQPGNSYFSSHVSAYTPQRSVHRDSLSPCVSGTISLTYIVTITVTIIPILSNVCRSPPISTMSESRLLQQFHKEGHIRLPTSCMRKPRHIEAV